MQPLGAFAGDREVINCLERLEHGLCRLVFRVLLAWVDRVILICLLENASHHCVTTFHKRLWLMMLIDLLHPPIGQARHVEHCRLAADAHLAKLDLLVRIEDAHTNHMVVTRAQLIALLLRIGCLFATDAGSDITMN